jgi:hypothetical protein
MYTILYTLWSHISFFMYVYISFWRSKSRHCELWFALKKLWKFTIIPLLSFFFLFDCMIHFVYKYRERYKEKERGTCVIKYIFFLVFFFQYVWVYLTMCVGVCLFLKNKYNFVFTSLVLIIIYHLCIINKLMYIYHQELKCPSHSDTDIARD